MIFAVLPGISGVTLMVLAIPFTFGWDPLHIMLLFGALVGSATFIGSVTAILLNIPGTAPNAATVLDGYPMALKGQAKTAIGCSAMASALGSTFGIFVLIGMIPIMRRAILAFGPAEFLMLAIWGLTTIATVTRGSMIKGLAAAGIGLLLAFVGLDPRTAEMRYTFGSIYLRSGLGVIPILLGIFALAETIDLMVTGRPTISGKTQAKELTGNLSEGIRAVFTHLGLFIRSSVIGTVVGMIPGIGGTVAGFAAYGQAVQTARGGHDDFGHGDIRGVIAPEAANDAKDGAALVPTLAFGVPGSEATVVLLAALTLHGIIPGKELMTGQLHLVFVLIWSLFLANWFTSIFGLALVNIFAWVTVLRTHLICPLICVFAALAAFIYKGRMEDVLLSFVFGITGYFMKKHGWSRVTLVIAIVLGPLFETNLHIAMKLHQLGRINFWTRPITLILVWLTVLSLSLPYLKAFRAVKGKQMR
jgi:TctA family transporter